jgi:hypothetical protein
VDFSTTIGSITKLFMVKVSKVSSGQKKTFLAESVIPAKILSKMFKNAFFAFDQNVPPFIFFKKIFFCKCYTPDGPECDIKTSLTHCWFEEDGRCQ